MIGELVTLPLRLSVRTASFFLRSSEEVLKRALALTGRTVEAEPSYGAPPSDGSDGRAQTTPAAATAAPAPTPPPPLIDVEPEPVFDDEPTPLVESPSHVSEEPEIVEELAEPGAEEGAGAEVRIDEPWDGYAQMSAQQVIARVGDATPAELAAIGLYESANQARETVLSAVERQLRLINGDGTSD